MNAERAACAECGASGELGRCEDLFNALLALDHGRRQPWGRFHGLSVACFLLQHPSKTPGSATGGQWEIVTTFLAGGLETLNELEAQRVRSNRGGRQPRATVDAPPARSHPPTFTIGDASVDGTFPAAGYEDRMRAWAESVAAERGADSDWRPR